MKLMNVRQTPVVAHAQVAQAQVSKQAVPAVSKQCCAPAKAGKALNIKG